MLVSAGKPHLAFISPVFLFPNDAGGKIRTTNILRGMKGQAFHITLVGPATVDEVRDWSSEIDGVCDEFIRWEPVPKRARWQRAADLLDRLPVNVAADRTTAAALAVKEVAQSPAVDVLVFDFVHSAVLWPAELQRPTVCFTHNVEAEIFDRHAQNANGFFERWLWRSQHAKMKKYEAEALSRFTTVIAVSERDARFFRDSYNITDSQPIPTGVDLNFFSWRDPPAVAVGTPPTVVFTGSMDWAANIEGVTFFLEQVWPLVLAALPDSRFVVVGRSPPANLVQLARSTRNVEFTGFVDDVRPFVHSAHAFVIPLRVGGGTRIKAFEAMAMGCPVVSTSIGIEGLDIEPDVHFVQRDGAHDMATGLVAVLRDSSLRSQLSRRARRLVEEKFGHQVASRAFERICLRAIERAGSPSATDA